MYISEDLIEVAAAAGLAATAVDAASLQSLCHEAHILQFKMQSEDGPNDLGFRFVDVEGAMLDAIAEGDTTGLLTDVRCQAYFLEPRRD